MLRSRLPRISHSRIFRRCLHQLPNIPSEFQNGIPDFLSAGAIDISWSQYQQLMLDKLNKLTAGTPDQDAETKQLLIKYARQPEYASLFNFASMAHNNHFFFDCLSVEKTEISPIFKSQLETSFSSMESLRSTFIKTADAMFGPGFVWLVIKNREKSQEMQSMRPNEFGILTTYHAGSPYPGAHYRQQSRDMNTQNAESAKNSHLEAFKNDVRDVHLPVNGVGAFGDKSESGRNAKLLTGGFKREDSLVPLFGLNTWEHVWLPDYGIGNKIIYAHNFWEKIDWQKAENKISVPFRGT